MTIAPTYITIDERMKRGLCSPLQIGHAAGIWYHHIPGTDILETVYDPRAGWKLTGDFFKQLVPGPSHIGGYFVPGAPLPQPTGRCQDRAEMNAQSDPKNWRFVGWSKAASFPGTTLPDAPAGQWGEFTWIGPRLAIGSPLSMSVPRERMHEMVGARGLGQTSADYARVNSTVWLTMSGSALVTGALARRWTKSTPKAVAAGAAGALVAGMLLIRSGYWAGA